MNSIPDRTAGKAVIKVAKIALAMIVVWALIEYKLLDVKSLAGLLGSPALVLAAVVALFLGIVASGIRWWVLLRSSGYHQISLGRVLQIQLIGNFFSAFLPGAAGGDAIRGVYLYRLMPSGRSKALFTILADRAFSLIGLLSCAVVTCVWMSWTHLEGAATRQYTILTSVILVAGAMGALLSFILMAIISKNDRIEWIPGKLRRFVTPITSAVLSYRTQKSALLLCWLISVIASGVVIVGMIFISNIFPFAAPHVTTAAAGVFGNLFSSIPVTPGGVGVGESVFAKTCADLTGKVAPYASIYFAFRLCGLLSNLPGLAVYLLYERAPLNLYTTE
jgi:uncharacterized protein (TIRG00374 family)